MINGTKMGVVFDGTEDYSERITTTTPDGQYARNIVKSLEDAIHECRP
jgi:hypothetical protein